MVEILEHGNVCWNFVDFDLFDWGIHYSLSSNKRRQKMNCDCTNKTMTMIELCYRDLIENGIEKD